MFNTTDCDIVMKSSVTQTAEFGYLVYAGTKRFGCLLLYSKFK